MKKIIVCLLLFALILVGCKKSEFSDNSGENNSQTVQTSNQSRKIIFTYNCTIYTDDLNKSIDVLLNLIENYSDAYIENSEKQSGKITYKIRVKSEDYSNFTGELKNLGDIKNDKQTTEDISKTYFDLEAYLDAKLAEEKRLLELYNQAQTIADMKYISENIAKVQEEINIAKSTLNNYDLLVALSTINITIHEEQAKDKLSFGAKLSKVLINTGKGILTFLEYALYTIIYLLPFAALATAGVFIYKYINKRIKKK